MSDIADADGYYLEPWAALYNAHEADDFEGQMVPAVRELLAKAWDEGFMNAAGQDHPAYPRTRFIANPYTVTR